jgi:hypothetical protein
MKTRRILAVAIAAIAFAGSAVSADANKGKGGGTPPSYSTCTPEVVDPATYTGSCSATNPAGRTCTQEYVLGQPTNYYCTRS